MSFALVDCNSFFCSCERLFRPELNNKPVIVLSNNDGCAIARTPEAKKLGIKMGDPYFKIKDLCKKHKVYVFSSNFSLYTNISDRVMLTLSEMTDLVEVYSVDEAFLNFKGFPVSEYETIGTNIRQKILKDIGIPVGVGIGPTKVLSKLANQIAKKTTGVVSLHTQQRQDQALANFPIEDIWGIGRANSAKMNTLGIRTAKQLRDYKNERLIQKMFTKVGLQIKHELMGISCFKLNLDIQKKKEIMCSRSFGSGVYDKEDLKKCIANYVTKAGESLRAQNSVCANIEVFFRTNAFNNTPQHYAFESAKLLSPTMDTFKLIKIAHELVDNIYLPGYEYKKAGIRLKNIIDKNQQQLSLFEPTILQDKEQLMKTMDRVNRIEGEKSLFSAACGVNNQAWAMNRNHKSPRYTTSWNELKKVK